jgi:hypothetical protein
VREFSHLHVEKKTHEQIIKYSTPTSEIHRRIGEGQIILTTRSRMYNKLENKPA